jgi:hypothetical protein
MVKITEIHYGQVERRQTRKGGGKSIGNPSSGGQAQAARDHVDEVSLRVDQPSRIRGVFNQQK